MGLRGRAVLRNGTTRDYVVWTTEQAEAEVARLQAHYGDKAVRHTLNKRGFIVYGGRITVAGHAGFPFRNPDGVAEVMAVRQSADGTTLMYRYYRPIVDEARLALGERDLPHYRKRVLAAEVALAKAEADVKAARDLLAEQKADDEAWDG